MYKNTVSGSMSIKNIYMFIYFFHVKNRGFPEMENPTLLIKITAIWIRRQLSAC